MGLITVMMTLANPKRPDIEPLKAEALVDTGSVYLVIPEHVQLQLQLEEQSKKEVELADGSQTPDVQADQPETRLRKGRQRHERLIGPVLLFGHRLQMDGPSRLRKAQAVGP